MQETYSHLEALRDTMRALNIDATIIPGTDPHHSEYINDHWKLRDWLTGFTGSNGTVVVTLVDARLWTDSRYFLQAEQQLEDSGVTMMRENGEDPDQTIEQWLAETLEEDALVAIDGRLFTVMEANRLERFCGENGFMLATEFFAADKVWNDRPEAPVYPAYVHSDDYAGESTESKLERVVDMVENMGADAVFVSALDEIAWLFNLRGSDVEFTPVVTAYAFIGRDDYSIFIDRNKLTSDVESHLKKCSVRIRDYDDVIRFLERRSEHETVLIDPNTVSDTMSNALPCLKVYASSPVVALKAIKNDVQIEGIRKAMEHDGAAMVRLLKWVEETAPGGTINEIDVWEKGKELRALCPEYRYDSFAMIAGYKEHGAIVHYEADEQSASTLHGEGLLLIDSGGQYLYGTTDITRTITLGNPTPQEMHDYTLVLKGHLALSRAQFPEGVCGVNLDILARLPLWQEGMTYWHGTGHGVGHFLGCHEGPHSIRTEQNATPLRPGMITSNEPGLYKAGEYGIRTENILLVVPSVENEDFGRFYKFETLTLCPYDLRLIDRSMLTDEEVQQINEYHSIVFNRLVNLLNPDEQEWLKAKTQPL